MKNSYSENMIKNMLESFDPDISDAKIQEDMKCIYDSGEKLLNDIEKQNPAYLDAVVYAVRTMRRSALMQVVLGDQDYKRAIRRLELFHQEEYEEIYEWGCNSLFRAKLLYDMCKKDEDFKKITPPDMRAVLLEDQYEEGK